MIREMKEFGPSPHLVDGNHLHIHRIRRRRSWVDSVGKTDAVLALVGSIAGAVVALLSSAGLFMH